jgi:hypothetical protein
VAAINGLCETRLAAKAGNLLQNSSSGDSPRTLNANRQVDGGSPQQKWNKRALFTARSASDPGMSDQSLLRAALAAVSMGRAEQHQPTMDRV